MAKGTRAHVVGPLAQYADGFRAELSRLGYTAGSTENHVWLMADLSRWTVAQGLRLGDLSPDQVERYCIALGFVETPAVGFDNSTQLETVLAKRCWAA